jgi:toluene monooxygenase system protein E
MAFAPVAAVAELWDRDITARSVDDCNVLLVRLDGAVYAYENRCAHLGVALSKGRLDGAVLTCSAHHWQYDVRTGRGVNPATACLKRFAVKIENGTVLVDVNATPRDMALTGHVDDRVGPVLIPHPIARAVLGAIRRLNPFAEIQDRGSYIRVLAPRRCVVTRAAVEGIHRQPFDFRSDLEIMMPSFKGRMHLGDNEAVWTFETDASSGANATATGPEYPEISQRRTYWHLSDLGRNPTDYDIVTSRLHHWMGRGFEVRLPTSAWYEKYQRGSDLHCRDWEQWSDPRRTTYTTYTTMQHTRETYVNGLLDSITDDYDQSLSPEWVSILGRVLPILRYSGHALQMLAAYVGQMAPSGRITIAAAFQAGDEMRRVQRLAYRMRQLQVTHPDFGSAALQIWQDDPMWQPLREVIENLLITWDWGEALVALQFVLKPAFDGLFMTQFARLARAAGDDVLARIFISLDEDCAWHRAWSHSLIMTAIRDTPESAAAVGRWVARWMPRVDHAVAAFQPIFHQTLPGGLVPFQTVLDHIDELVQRQRTGTCGTGGLPAG